MSDSHALTVNDPASEHALQHHFADLEQQKQSSTLGMWLFLVTEIMSFGALIAAYLIYRMAYPDAWQTGGAHMDFWLGTVNTVVLLCSSFTMVVAVWAAQTGNRRLLVMFLIITMILGIGFEGFKGLEYFRHFEEGSLPGPYWHLDVANPFRVQMFFLIYFIMTGVHAIHLAIGIILLGVLAWFSHKGKYSANYYTPIENAGLYWHFVDIVWVFLYPLLYLIAHHHAGG
ncbi:MAG TPA: cytochrome c oxidase subunit 3 family protein [Terriglobales bacterium]|nr:cytochrome c oxidase subunit 3 family protein [Terriglobales bacterium]